MGLLIVNLNASRNVSVTPALMHTVATAVSEEGGTSLPGGCRHDNKVFQRVLWTFVH